MRICLLGPRIGNKERECFEDRSLGRRSMRPVGEFGCSRRETDVNLCSLWSRERKQSLFHERVAKTVSERWSEAS